MKELDHIEPYDEQVTKIHLKKGTRDRLAKCGPFKSTWDKLIRVVLDHWEQCNSYESDKFD